MPVIASEGSSRQVPLFFEAGGTIVPLTYLTRSEYRYTQLYRYDTGRPRWQAVRVKDIYLQRLIHLPAPLRRSPVSVFDLEAWTRQRLQQVAPPGPLTTALRQTEPGDPLPPEVWAEAATRLADYFAYSGDFAYSLTLRRDNPDLDPVADFLLRVRQGPCERYASSLALALRSLGIPSRLVKGYRGVEGDEEEGTYLVRHSHAHAWVEAYVPAEDDAPQSYDWLVLDPTPGNDPGGTPALLRWLQERQRTGQTLWRDLIFGYNAHQHQEMIQRPAAAIWPWPRPPSADWPSSPPSPGCCAAGGRAAVPAVASSRPTIACVPCSVPTCAWSRADQTRASWPIGPPDCWRSSRRRNRSPACRCRSSRRSTGCATAEQPRAERSCRRWEVCSTGWKPPSAVERIVHKRLFAVGTVVECNSRDAVESHTGRNPETTRGPAAQGCASFCRTQML